MVVDDGGKRIYADDNTLAEWAGIGDAEQEDGCDC